MVVSSHLSWGCILFLLAGVGTFSFATSLRDLVYSLPVLLHNSQIHSDYGTPQGGVISPLLANVYLNEMDWHIPRLSLMYIQTVLPR
ncbi:hypothetical protein NGI46_10190 [Peribacillus butanolivorans]|nr:hypothetical protein [Peribacillus butanolivorans]